MTIRFFQGDEPPVDFLAVTEGFCREAAEELARAIKGVRAGQIEDAKTAVQAVKDLKAAFRLVMEERNNVEKHRKELAGSAAGSVGGGALDLDAARDEIGRRLARLRDAGAG